MKLDLQPPVDDKTSWGTCAALRLPYSPLYIGHFGGLGKDIWISQGFPNLAQFAQETWAVRV